MDSLNDSIELGLSYDLAIGIRGGANPRREVSLLPGNGIAEKVFLKKIPEKPYTWIGNVLSVAIKSIDGEMVGAEVRDDYVKENTVNIPSIVRRLPLADANSGLLEVHRRLWQNLIPKQTCMCKFCGKTFVMDIDLNRISHTAENLEFIEAILGNPDPIELMADLKDGFEFTPFQKNGDKGFKNEEYAGVYNRFVYRTPTLDDAIRNEKLASDDVAFWRRMAYDCLLRIERVTGVNTPEEVVELTLPRDVNALLGTRLYDRLLSSRDLKLIRAALREKLPTLPFGYEETCPSCDRETPIAMEAASFFSA